MPDASWESPQDPAPQRRRRWMGWTLGCGTAALLSIGALAVIGNVLANRAFTNPEVRDPFVKKALWPQLRRVARDLASDEGASALYARSPGLKDRYPTESAFLAEARTWRPSLAGMPEDPPGPERLALQMQFFGLRAVVLLPDGKRFLVRSAGRGKGHIPITDLQLR